MPELKKAIEEFMHAWNEHLQPFVWTAKLEEILKKIDQAQAKVEQIKPRSTLSRGKRR